MKDNIPVLTEEQIATIHAEWARGVTSIQDLTRTVFNDPTLDGRTNQGKAVKLYLASRGDQIKTTKREVNDDVILNEHHKLFIRSNAENMKVFEMTKTLFPDREIKSMLNAECRAVLEYTKEVRAETVDFWDEPVETKEYAYPKSIQGVLGLANSYVANPIDPTKPAYDFNNLRPYDLKCLRALQGYLKSHRVRYQASLYDKKADRILFESTVVRYIHDKPDLSAPDVDMYVSAASETVNISREERKILKLEDQLTNMIGGEGEEKQRLTQAFVELLNQTRTKWDASKGRHKGIIESLESSRAKRDEHKTKRNESILNLVEAWMKDEQTRHDILAFGEKEKREDEAEVKRLTDMEGIVALIAGHTRAEASS